MAEWFLNFQFRIPPWARIVLGIGTWQIAQFLAWQKIVREKESLAPKGGLEILWGNSRPFVQETEYEHIGGTIERGKLFRVGVKSTTSQTVEDVQVRLEETDPHSLDCLPAPLHIMNDNPPSGGQFQTEFRLNAGETVYLDVAGNALGGTSIFISHAVPRVPNMIPEGRYRLTILAHGRNAAPRKKEFVLEADENRRMRFYPVQPT